MFEKTTQAAARNKRARLGFRGTLGLSTRRSVTRGWSLCSDHAAAAASGLHLGVLTLTAQLLETCVDRRKIIGSSGTSSLATQFLDASADHRKIVSGTGSGHIFSPLR